MQTFIYGNTTILINNYMIGISNIPYVEADSIEEMPCIQLLNTDELYDELNHPIGWEEYCTSNLQSDPLSAQLTPAPDDSPANTNTSNSTKCKRKPKKINKSKKKVTHKDKRKDNHKFGKKMSDGLLGLEMFTWFSITNKSSLKSKQSNP